MRVCPPVPSPLLLNRRRSRHLSTCRLLNALAIDDRTISKVQGLTRHNDLLNMRGKSDREPGAGDGPEEDDDDVEEEEEEEKGHGVNRTTTGMTGNSGRLTPISTRANMTNCVRERRDWVNRRPPLSVSFFLHYAE